MYYEPGKTKHGLPFNPLKACVAPRPIGWVTTLNKEGRVNLAPFSFFNMFSANPCYVGFATGPHETDGGIKDSTRNVRDTGEFVYNIATYDLRNQVNDCGNIIDHTINEMEATGLEAAPSVLVKPPRVAASPVQFECVLHDIIELPGRSPDQPVYLAIGKAIGIHIADEVITPDGRVDILKIRPISRLGYMDYAVVDEVFEMQKDNEMGGPEYTSPRKSTQAAE